MQPLYCLDDVTSTKGSVPRHTVRPSTSMGLPSEERERGDGPKAQSLKQENSYPKESSVPNDLKSVTLDTPPQVDSLSLPSLFPPLSRSLELSDRHLSSHTAVVTYRHRVCSL